MRAWSVGAAVGVFVAAAVIGGASCGDDDDEEAAAGPQVDPDPLNLEIQSVTLPEGPAARPVVRFRVTDAAGAPLDLAAEIANSNASPRAFPNVVPRFTLAQLDDLGNYTSYYASSATAAAYTVPAGSSTPPTSAATQATAQPGTPWPLADLVSVGNGAYDFTMPATTVTGLDRTKTHTLAGWVVRARSALDTDVAYSSFNFVPTGGAAAQKDEVVSDAGCNRCHGTLQAHGTRRGTQFCITCHSPQTTDPETSRTVDFKVMIHKIHFGQNLPSVQQGSNYFIVGFRQTVHDFSDVAFPWHDGVQHCTVCHVGEDADNWRTRPSAAACTSCHDNVQFASGPPSCATVTPVTANCLHTGGALAITNPNDPASCTACHGPNGIAPVGNFHHGD